MHIKIARSFRFIIGFLLISGYLIFIGSASLQASEEFQVNTYTSGHQNYSSVAVDGNGNFIIV